MFQRPAGDVASIVVGLLQVGCPAVERHVLFNHNAEPAGNLLPVTRNPWHELRHQARMIELPCLLVVFLQVRPKRTHPQRVALKQDILARDAAGVVLDQATKRQRMSAVEAKVRVALLAR